MRRYAGLAVVGMIFVGVLAGCQSTGDHPEHPDKPEVTETVPDVPVVEDVPDVPKVPDVPDVPTGDLGSPKNPIAVSMAAKIKVDGDLADWAKIKALPMPFMKSPTGPVKLAWSAAGLYGAITVVDKELAIDPGEPWSSDCVEIWVEKDAARAFDMGMNASQIALVADPDSKTGDCLVVVPSGSDAELDGEAGIVAKWKKTKTGYVIEFLFPAKALAPAKMVAGTKIGLNFAIDDDGAPVAQFYCDKSTDEAYRTPELWGTIVLKK
jgi:cellulose/xylan binding protein with CBM9 domain